MRTPRDDSGRAPILHLAGSEVEAEPVDPAHFGGGAREGWRKQSDANLPRMTKSRAAFRRFRSVRLRFTPRATRDLADIAEYLRTT